MTIQIQNQKQIISQQLIETLQNECDSKMMELNNLNNFMRAEFSSFIERNQVSSQKLEMAEISICHLEKSLDIIEKNIQKASIQILNHFKFLFVKICQIVEECGMNQKDCDLIMKQLLQITKEKIMERDIIFEKCENISNILKEKEKEIKLLNAELLKKDKIHFQNVQKIKNEYDDYIFKLTNEKGRNYGVDFYKQMYMQQKIQHEKEIEELKSKYK
eukprot:gene3446-6095_t